jgi:hypothetical protein
MRRPRRTALRSSALSGAQSELLTIGAVILRWSGADAVRFDSDAEAAAAWARHRTELMAAAFPGSRPFGFWKYDLQVAPPRAWHAQLAGLLDRGLIGAEEVLRIERSRPELAPGAESFGAAYEDAESIRRQRLGEVVLRGLAGEFAIASRWHEWRGRPQLAAAFRLRAAVVASVAKELYGER